MVNYWERSNICDDYQLIIEVLEICCMEVHHEYDGHTWGDLAFSEGVPDTFYGELFAI